jgi:hypothetical protein
VARASAIASINAGWSLPKLEVEPAGDWSAELPPSAPDDSFASPFDEEYDVPAFLRKKASQSDEKTDREVPAFLRRSAD